MTFKPVIFSIDDIQNNNSDECHLLLDLISCDIHPSVHPSIQLVTHSLFNMSMAPFNNPPYQSVILLARPFLRGATVNNPPDQSVAPLKNGLANKMTDW
jgi:hypothetical protein